MRELKFRAWDLETMHYNVFPTGLDQVYDPNGGFWRKVKNIMQYTGFKDKNGIEIYEGDVLHVSYNRIGNQKVFWGYGEWSIKNYNLESCTVIGNIYQNPKL